MDCFTCHQQTNVIFEAEKAELIPKTQLEANLFSYVCDTCLDKRVSLIKAVATAAKPQATAQSKIKRIG